MCAFSAVLLLWIKAFAKCMHVWCNPGLNLHSCLQCAMSPAYAFNQILSNVFQLLQYYSVMLLATKHALQLGSNRCFFIYIFSMFILILAKVYQCVLLIFFNCLF